MCLLVPDHYFHASLVVTHHYACITGNSLFKGDTAAEMIRTALQSSHRRANSRPSAGRSALLGLALLFQTKLELLP